MDATSSSSSLPPLICVGQFVTINRKSTKTQCIKKLNEDKEIQNIITMIKMKLRIKNNKPEYCNPLSVPDSKAWEEIPRLCAKLK
jgi:hypothetical protein